MAGRKTGRKKNGERPLILVSNDDGMRSAGITALARALKELGDVYVVAPDRERSAASHSLTLHRPLRVEKVGPRSWTVDGTPTDSVTVAVHGLLPRRPSVVVSGINRGGNLGEDVLYSGTVSAAMEGTLLGIPSIAYSLVEPNKSGKFDYTASAAFAKRLTKYVLRKGLPEDTLLSVNIPAGRNVSRYSITTLGKRYFSDAIVEKTDPRGKKYYWIGGDMERWVGGEDSDFHAINHGRISVTPLHLDMTNYSTIGELKRWRVR